MIQRALTLAILSTAMGADAACLMDPPELGDIGPGSAIVCRDLESRFPDAELVVAGREILSAARVAVTALVNRGPVSLRYRLDGYAWRLEDDGTEASPLPPRS
jgi:hypothetical protein